MDDENAPTSPRDRTASVIWQQLFTDPSTPAEPQYLKTYFNLSDTQFAEAEMVVQALFRGDAQEALWVEASEGSVEEEQDHENAEVAGKEAEGEDTRVNSGEEDHDEDLDSSETEETIASDGWTTCSFPVPEQLDAERISQPDIADVVEEAIRHPLFAGSRRTSNKQEQLSVLAVGAFVRYVSVLILDNLDDWIPTLFLLGKRARFLLE